MALSLITKAQDNLDYIKNPLNMIDHQFPAKESDFMDTNQLLSGMMSQHFNSDQMSMLLKSGMQQEELLHANVTGRSQKSATDQHSNGAEKQILDMRNAIENDIKAYLEIMNNIQGQLRSQIKKMQKKMAILQWTKKPTILHQDMQQPMMEQTAPTLKTKKIKKKNKSRSNSKSPNPNLRQSMGGSKI